MKKSFSYSMFLILLLLPLVATAQVPEKLTDFLTRIGTVITTITLIVSSLALLFFIYGLVKFIFYADNDEKRLAGKKSMLWGVIALFIMVSIWGIVNLLAVSLDVGGPKSYAPPIIDSPYFGAE